MSTRAVFFDFTGTLYDPASDHEAHLRTSESFVRHFGLAVTPDSLCESLSLTVRRHLARLSRGQYLPGDRLMSQLLGRFSALFGVERSPENLELMKRITSDMHARHARAMPFALRCLDAVRDAGLHVGVISHIDRDMLLRIMESLDLDHRVDSVTSAEDVGVCRPDLRILEHALSLADVRPEEAIMVGDDPQQDIEPACRLGCVAVHYRSPGSESAEGAHFVIHSLTELQDMVLPHALCA